MNSNGTLVFGEAERPGGGAQRDGCGAISWAHVCIHYLTIWTHMCESLKERKTRGSIF